MEKMLRQTLLWSLVLVALLTLLPGGVEAAGTGTIDDPILIDSMDQLIAEFEKDTEGATYYKLTEDISHETSIEYLDGREDHTGDDGYTTVRKPQMAQCVVGTGKKFLELDGYDIHYKNNVNFNLGDDNSKFRGSGPKYDSLTFFYLGEGCDLTVTNSTGDEARVWYDGWMHNRTNFFGGPNYIYTAVRDVFHVDAGAELTVNNTDIKAGRNRKIWMVHSFYLDKDKETNLLVKLTYNGYAYEQIYGSAIVVNGGKVTINGGYIEGRGGYRNEYNISGVKDWDKDNVADMVWGGDFTTDDMLENCLSNRGTKAAVQIAGEGSTVIINDGEFWGCGGADVIGINTLGGGSVKEYTLRINAGTFDTSKTDKERVPDRNAGTVNNGPWPWSASNWMLWANCRCIRDTLRGNIGIPAVDGYGNNVFNTKMVHVYIDEEEEEDECFSNEELDFRRKSDSDTIIVKPREAEDHWSTDTHTWRNYRDDSHYEIYVYSMGEEISTLLDHTTHYIRGFYYEPAVAQGLYYSAESNYDLTDVENPYFSRAHVVFCQWILYIEDANGNLIDTASMISAPFHTEHVDGHTVYNFKVSMNSFKNVEWDEDHDYYMVAIMQERFDSIEHSYVTESYPTGVLDHDSYHYGIGIEYDPDYCSSFASSGAEVTYSNAAYNCDPVLTFNDAYKKLKGSKTFQWQVLEGDGWVDYGNPRISPELATEVLLKHKDLTRKQVRMKITSYDGIYKDALYSNVCQVQPDQNTRMPSVGTLEWYEDPTAPGKYVLEVVSKNVAQEYLIYPHANSRDHSTLEWDKATSDPVFSGLDMGYYDVYTRYKATTDYAAGTEIVRARSVAGPYTLTQGFEIRHNDKPVDEVIVEVGKEFRLRAVANPEDATDKTIINRTSWSPESDKTQMISASWLGTYHKFENNYTGSSIWLRGDEVGVVTVQALTTLDDGTNALHKVTIRIVPEGYVPYTVTVLNNGAEVVPGALFDPLLRLHDRKDSRVDGDLIPESDIKLALQSQILARKINWTLVGGDLSYDRLRPVVSNAVASMRMDTGRIKVLEGTKPGTVIRYVGYLDDPYLGRITIPGSITVVEAPVEEEPHTQHVYDSYAELDDRNHYCICECGERITKAHELEQYLVQAATLEADAVYGYICDCGYSYQEVQTGTKLIHTHIPDYACDMEQHWQICMAEDCPEEDYATEKQDHVFVSHGTDDEGREVEICEVCGVVKTDDIFNVTITTQPKSVKVLAGQTAQVTVEAIGDGLTYKWYYKNAGDSKYTYTSSFTGPSYKVTMSEARSGRKVYCKISDAYGNTVKSKTVSLNMGVAAKILSQPKDAVAAKGVTAKITVTASGDGLSYAWYYKNKGDSKFTKTGSFTGNTYSLSMTQARSGRQVYCVVTDRYGTSVKSKVATLYMGTVAKITAQPKNVVAASGTTAKVTLKAVGDGLTYKWYYRNKGTTAYTRTTTFTGTSYSITMTSARDGRQVYCVVTDKYGNSVKSNVVTLTKGNPAKITAQPKSVTAEAGTKAKISLTATGDGLTYRWQINTSGTWKDTTTTGYKTAAITVSATAARNGYKYRCIITDKYGNTVTSAVATLTVT